MPKSKKISSNEIVSLFMELVSERGNEPYDIEEFCELASIKVDDFHNHFTSIQTLKTSIFTTFFENTITVLHKSDDFLGYDPRTKLLSFYYTFFEILTINRDYVMVALRFKKELLNGLKSFSGLRKNFKEFVQSLGIETLSFKQEQLDRLQQNAISESAYAQLLLVMKFWMDDTSDDFEKTDVLIEKSINTSFEILNITPIKSVIDLAKFIYQERIMK